MSVLYQLPKMRYEICWSLNWDCRGATALRCPSRWRSRERPAARVAFGSELCAKCPSHAHVVIYRLNELGWKWWLRVLTPAHISAPRWVRGTLLPRCAVPPRLLTWSYAGDNVLRSEGNAGFNECLPVPSLFSSTPERQHLSIS